MDVAKVEAILNLVEIVGENASIQKTVKESVKGGMITFAGTVLGGILLGPAGLLIGGIASSAAAYFLKQNDFVSLKQAMDSMCYEDREQIAYEMNTFIQSLDEHDIAALTAMALKAIKQGGVEELLHNPMLHAIRERAFTVVSEHLPNTEAVSD